MKLGLNWDVRSRVEQNEDKVELGLCRENWQLCPDLQGRWPRSVD